MPLGFGRNFQGMLATVPGASRPFRPHSEFFNSQDSLVVERQRPVAPRQQRADRGHRQQPQDRPADGADPVGRSARDRQRHDQQLRRRVRARRRRGHQRRRSSRAPTSSRAAASASATPRRRSATNPFVDRTLPKERQKAEDAVQPVRLHARRPDHPQQAVLLRRLRPHQRRPRPRQPLHRPDRGDAQRRLQRLVGADLRPADRRSGDRRRPHASSRATGFRPSRISPIAQQHPGQRAAAEHRRRGARARSTTRTRRSASAGPTASTSSSTTRRRRRIRCRSATASSGRRSFEPGNYADDSRRPVSGRLRRHRRQHDATASPATGRARWTNTLVMDVARRRQHVPQRGAQRRQRPEHGDRGRHPGRQPRRLTPAA